MSKNYIAADIEVLSGLEPVRRRPGMYTDTSRPNHLAHEVIDNSESEVKQAAESMLDLLNNNFTIHKILKKQKIFWSHLENSLGYQINKNVIICPRFYSSNITLFEN